MHYYGGKSRTGKDIAKVLKSLISSIGPIKGYIEPFCGALGVMRHMTNDYFVCYASDSCKDLILLFKEIVNDTFIKPDMTEAEYKSLKYSESSALRGYAGFGLSYSGQWFRAYSQKYIGKRNQNDESFNALMNIKDSIKRVEFTHCDYRNCNEDIVNGGYLIYCDPPYKHSLYGYEGCSHSFNSEEFWTTVKQWKEYGNIVVVSERECPIKHEILYIKQLCNIDKTVYVDKLFLIV